MINDIDVAVIGAGPAGLSAARRLGEAGLSVWLIDENEHPGGQFLRHVTHTPFEDPEKVLGEEYAAGFELAASAGSAPFRYLPRTLVWQITADKRLYLLNRSHRPGPSIVRARFIVLATGAQERSFPLPGWTLPGAMSIGAAQLLMKSAGLLPPSDCVLVGNGPLMLLFAAQVSRAGGRIRAILDTTHTRDYFRSLPTLPAALRYTSGQLIKGMRLLGEIRRAGIPYYSGVSQLAIQGEGQVSGIRCLHRGKPLEFSTSSVLSHIGVIPETQMANALGCQLTWDSEQQYWYPFTGEHQETSRVGVYMAGDGGGIAGAQTAQLSAELAAIGILLETGMLSAEDARRQGDDLRHKIARQKAIRPFLSKLYPLPEQLTTLDDEVTICRCEQVSAGEIRRAGHQGCQGVNQLKAFTRCGMGPCQGRMCMHNAARLLAENQQRSIADVGFMRVRFPLKPITVADIAHQNDAGEESDEM